MRHTLSTRCPGVSRPLSWSRAINLRELEKFWKALSSAILISTFPLQVLPTLLASLLPFLTLPCFPANTLSTVHIPGHAIRKCSKAASLSIQVDRGGSSHDGGGGESFVAPMIAAAVLQCICPLCSGCRMPQVRRFMWYQLYLDDLPMWGMVGEVRG